MKPIRVIIIVVFILFAVPRVVHAKDIGKIFLYSEDNNGEYVESEKEIVFEGYFTLSEKAFILLDDLVSNVEGMKTCVPAGTKVIWVNIEKGKLNVNFNKEVEKCAGNYNQEHFVNQIVKTIYSLEEIRSIMVFVEGNESGLPEGIDFSYFDR